MNKKMAIRISAVAFVLATALGTSACSNNDTTENPPTSETSQSSSSVSEFSVNWNASENSLTYTPITDDEFIPKGKADIVVKGSDWSATDQPSSGTVYPDLPVGSYTATVTFKNPDGSVATGESQFAIDKQKTEWTLEKSSVPANGGDITLTLTGAPQISGTVTAYVSEDGVDYNKKIATSTVTHKASSDPTTAGTNTVTITMPASPKDGKSTTESVKFVYSGDSSNEKSEYSTRVSWRN